MKYKKIIRKTWNYKRNVPKCPAKGAFEIDYFGDVYFVVDSKKHREDGPAVMWGDGAVEYYRNGKCHRDDGPATVWANGAQLYFQHDLFHRVDGPAVIWADGAEDHYLFGQYYSKEAWEPLATLLSIKGEIL